MALQYREDTDRLLYITDTGASDGALMNECCCDTCSDSVACHRYDACCDDTTFEERPTYPHYVVISDTKYTALGDPACVIYNGCCYCDHDSTTNKALNVVDTGITADTSFTSCDSCNAVHEDTCEVCQNCNDCDPRLKRSYNTTIDATFKDSVFSTEEIQAQAQAALTAPTSVLASPILECLWVKTGVNDNRTLQWNPVSGGRWQLFHNFPEAKVVGVGQLFTDTGARDTCDPTGSVYTVSLVSPTHVEPGFSAVVS